ncbi:MAG: hypothetical protein JSU81_03740 [Candidatus Coatesbacteria bacterium]|nr:MAG: hypothetical protein JSU81_03740 [Candidatus Coatesbacteria bacterium]
MGFRVFDVLFVAVLILAAVAAYAAYNLVEPYPAVIVAAFAAGATAFLYLTVRVKLGGIVETVERRLADQESEAVRHREALDQSFADIEKLTRTMREQIQASQDKTAADLEAVRKNVTTTLEQATRKLEQTAAALAELKTATDKYAATADGRLEGQEARLAETTQLLHALQDEFNSFVADESSFRDGVQAQLADRVAYLEDFIREKRKSLQI